MFNVPSRKRADLLISAVLIALCLFWFVVTVTRVPDATMPGAPGPRFFPYIIVAVLSVLAAVLLSLSLRRETYHTDAGQTDEGLLATGAEQNEDGECIDPHDLIADRRTVIFSFVLILLYIAGIEIFGFYPATLIVLALILRFAMKFRNPVTVFAGSAGITVSIYLIFTLLLQLPLPRGTLW